MKQDPHAPPLRGSLPPEGVDSPGGGPAAGRTAAAGTVIARGRSVYGRWRRDTTVAQMRADWDALFSATGDAAFHTVMAGDVPCAWVDAPGVRRDRAIVYF